MMGEALGSTSMSEVEGRELIRGPSTPFSGGEGGWGTNVGDISFECCHLRITSFLLSASMPEVSVGGRAKGGWKPSVRSTLEGDFGEPLPAGEGEGKNCSRQ